MKFSHLFLVKSMEEFYDSKYLSFPLILSPQETSIIHFISMTQVSNFIAAYIFRCKTSEMICHWHSF